MSCVGANFKALFGDELVKRAEETPAFLDEFVEWVRDDRFKKAIEENPETVLAYVDLAKCFDATHQKKKA